MASNSSGKGLTERANFKDLRKATGSSDLAGGPMIHIVIV